MKQLSIQFEPPADQGYAMPAEWERHEATWIAWPHSRRNWPGKLHAIPWAFGEMVRKIAPGELVRVMVTDREHEAKARGVLQRVGVHPSRVEFFRLPLNRGWARDCGPLCIRTADKRPRLAVVDFNFNGWARYPDWRKDAGVARRLAKALGKTLFQAMVEGQPFVTEGGALEVNGRGTVVTTEECLLDQHVQVRNPGLNRQAVEGVLGGYLGVRNVIWLGQGVAGDDTHGHVDDLCRFVNPTTMILCQEPNPRDENHRALEDNRERLEGARLEDGSRPTVVRIPMPSPLFFDGNRLPASYANFYITNSAVLVPTFNDLNDRLALGILSELMPDRPVVGVHAVDLVWGFGTIHCLTQQQPAV